MQSKKIKVAVLASGRGSDFQSIIDAIGRKEVNAEIILLLTDNPEAKAIERAKKHGITCTILPRANYATRDEYDQAIHKRLDEAKPDLVVLAGYMRVIRDKKLLDAYRGKLINIHPSLLPKYPGATAQKDAFNAGENISGYTIHFVDASLDGGPIIFQEKLDISQCKSADEAAAIILEREHIGLPKVVQMFAEGKFKIEGSKVTYHRG